MNKPDSHGRLVEVSLLRTQLQTTHKHREREQECGLEIVFSSYHSVSEIRVLRCGYLDQFLRNYGC